MSNPLIFIIGVGLLAGCQSGPVKFHPLNGPGTCLLNAESYKHACDAANMGLDARVLAVQYVGTNTGHALCRYVASGGVWAYNVDEYGSGSSQFLTRDLTLKNNANDMAHRWLNGRDWSGPRQFSFAYWVDQGRVE